jgi:hypothetical protein
MKSVIVLAFANDRDEYLEMITRERKNIFKALQNHHDKGFVQVHKEENTSLEDIFNLFNRYHDRIVIFHYGGHANSTHLQLETPSGESKLAYAQGLAQLMGKEKQLQLVFLNGCATFKQVELLISAGVRAVIATSVPIDDKMATEFAEKFYEKLASQATIEEAFEFAKALITTGYGLSKDINLYRDLGWKGKDRTAKDEIVWGLYTNETSPEVLEWKLPETIPGPIIRVNSTDATTASAKVNTQLVETLINEIAQHSIKVRRLVEDSQESDEIDIRDIQQAIIDSFPVPVGEQLRRLFSGMIIDNDRLRQLVVTYESIIELIGFIMLSQLWEVRFKNHEIVIANDYLQELSGLFALDAENHRQFNYVKLIRTIAGIFKENKIEYFLEELSTLEDNFQAEDEFYKAHLFMEKMKTATFADQVKANEIENFCLEAEKHLGTILARLSFIVKYKLTTIKKIEIIKFRHKEPKYSHKKVIQDKTTAGLAEQTFQHDSFTEHNAVILLKNVKDVDQYLSLSPFIIDKNALQPHSKGISLLYFYSFQDTSGNNIFYKSFKKEDQAFTVSVKTYKEITGQFSDFKQDVLK